MFLKDGSALLNCTSKYDGIVYPIYSTENRFLLVVHNFSKNGYNHFELYIDKGNNIFYIYDDTDEISPGTNAYNRIDNYFIEMVCKDENINISTPEEVKIRIYTPANGGTGFEVQHRIYDVEGARIIPFGWFKEISDYEPFVQKLLEIQKSL
ncbi:hypothetical protein [Bacillus sp. FSL R12-0069]|uniref:hypothetical protein n=1 Tax=Bacillus sp. FSL R12-0069 TaxID=2975342 RepID=UPI0030F87C6B